jgi:hypothetical protein
MTLCRVSFILSKLVILFFSVFFVLSVIFAECLVFIIELSVAKLSVIAVSVVAPLFILVVSFPFIAYYSQVLLITLRRLAI